jgi:hypothetical protein
MLRVRTMRRSTNFKKMRKKAIKLLRNFLER